MIRINEQRRQSGGSMDKVGIGSILKSFEGILYLVVGLDERTIPPFLKLQTLDGKVCFLATEEGYELIC